MVEEKEKKKRKKKEQRVPRMRTWDGARKGKRKKGKEKNARRDRDQGRCKGVNKVFYMVAVYSGCIYRHFILEKHNMRAWGGGSVETFRNRF